MSPAGMPLAHLAAGWFSPHALRCVEPHSNSGAERSIRTGVAAELYRAAFHAASFLCAVAALRPPRAEAFDSNSSNSSNALWPLPGALRALRSSVGRLIEQCEAGEHAMRASEFCASLHALRKAVERLAATPLLPA